jgi:hypothetical protein
MSGRAASSETSDRLLSPRRLVGRGLVMLTGLLVVVVVAAAPAFAYWHSAGSGTGRATTATLARPTGVTVPASSASNVLVSWTASGGSPAPTGYYVTRVGGGTVAACGTSALVLVPGTSCTDSAVPNGIYTYIVTAVYRSWDAVGAASGSVTVVSATKVIFTALPGNAVATVAITPPVAVTVATAAGAPVPVANVSITVAIGTNPGGGTLSGALTALTNSSGVATFAGLSLDKAGVGYTLTAASTGLTSATSTTFTVSVGPAAKLAVTTSPTSSFAGQPFYDQPVVTVEDAGNNVVSTSTSAVTLTITVANGATLSCVAPQSAVAGVATFSGCAINTVGSYTLTATSGPLTGATSATFAVVAAPTHLAWSGPTTTVCGPSSGTPFALTYTGCTFLIVSVGSFTAKAALTDANGLPVTNLGTAVTVTLTPGHGTVSPQTVTIAHGQSISATTSTFNPQYPLFVTVDQVTASAASLISATAVLHS